MLLIRRRINRVSRDEMRGDWGYVLEVHYKKDPLKFMGTIFEYLNKLVDVLFTQEGEQV